MSTRLRYRSEAMVTAPGWRRWWPLVGHEFGMLFRSKWGIALFFLCLFPAVGRLVMLLILYGVVNFGPQLRQRMQSRGPGAGLAQLDPGNVEFYLEPVLAVMPGMVFVLLLSAFVMARTVARDRLSNALELYWTRGVTPGGYLLAKWLGNTAAIGLITFVAPTLLWLTAAFLHEDWSLLADSATTVLPGLLGLLVATGLWSAVCVGISACSSTPNGATVGWAMLLVGSSSMAVLLSSLLREPDLRLSISVWEAGGVLARGVAGAGGEGSVLGAAVLYGVLLLVLLGGGWRRLRNGGGVG